MLFFDGRYPLTLLRVHPRCAQGALTMTEPETPNIAPWANVEETKKAFEAYVAAVGKVAYEWNALHEQLGILFVAVSGAEREVALANWYSVWSDRCQRAMLRAKVNATNSERSKKRPEAPDDLMWLLDRADELAEDRNNAVHAPCSLYISGSGSEMGAAFFNGQPRARKLMGKELLVEFAWCESYAETLSSHRNAGNGYCVSRPLPVAPATQHTARECFSGDSRRS
jgi:TorA maturation chaperone TorD